MDVRDINFKKIALWIKVVIIGFALCGLVLYAYALPQMGESFADNFGPWYRDNCLLLWKIFLWVSGVPCYAVLALFWSVASKISGGQAFSRHNARAMKAVAVLAAVDTAYFFIGNFVLLALNLSHPGVMLASLVVVFVGFAVTVAAAGLSRLIIKAAELQDESDLTI